VIVVALFLHGFEFNPGHHLSDTGGRNAAHVLLYWLALLGGPLTLGDAGFAPAAGAVLLAGFAIVAGHGALKREPVAMFTAVFAIGALALVAFGRSEIAGSEINSRYLVLGCLAWALLIYVLLDLRSSPEKPLRLLTCMLPALVAFNVSANAKFAPLVDGYIEVRDRAATSFMQYGEDGRGVTRLHPKERHADIILQIAAERGVYRLPSVSHPATFPEARPNPSIITHFDELVVNDRAITAGGWAMRPAKESKRGQVYVVLRSTTRTLIFSSVTLERPDVAKAYDEPKWRRSGFRTVIERRRLPAEDFEVGVLIADGDHAEFKMTSNQILLAPGKAAKAVTSAP
jgi:hypothetical protein